MLLAHGAAPDARNPHTGATPLVQALLSPGADQYAVLPVRGPAGPGLRPAQISRCQAAAACERSNCASSVEPVSAVTLEAPPWITVVTSSK